MNQPTFCTVPKPVDPAEQGFWKIIREHHCQQGHGYRECAGRVICDRNGVTVQCHLCGDARQRFRADD